jgi:hypothetical protein
MKRLKLIIFIFLVTAALLLAVHFRSKNNSLFYKYCRISAEQNIFRQKLWQKQLEVESILNPASLSQRNNREK